MKISDTIKRDLMGEWTSNRTQQFWKRCGFQYVTQEFVATSKEETKVKMHGGFWVDPQGNQLADGLFPPNLTLDNLFIWAIPTIREAFIEKYKYTRYGKEHIEGGLAQFVFTLREWTDKLIDPDIDPALCLAELIERKFDTILKEAIKA